MSDRDKLVQAFKEGLQNGYKQQRGLQKTDDIIDFIKTHWKLFCRSRNEMMAAANAMGTNGIKYGVDSLCDQLAVPGNIFFKRSPVKDIGKAILNFRKSKLFEMFLGCCRPEFGNEACVFVVAGQSSIVITNMQTHLDNADLLCYIRSNGTANDIHIFRADEAPLRLPTHCNHSDE